MQDVPQDDTIICRCSDITRAELHAWIDRGMDSIDELKRMTRVCMGPCQGRTCRQLIMQELANKTGQPIESFTMPTFRQPLKGITLGAVAAFPLDSEEEAEEERP
ncbi:MAG: (2Fe-2S)-binding protein [Symbiobacteriaceae bacterium]|nr:(2Fe-2S)-binding protein [Symbiobacteriaceae bacterium]